MIHSAMWLKSTRIVPVDCVLFGERVHQVVVATRRLQSRIEGGFRSSCLWLDPTRQI
jgi:hypothetical protein